MATEGGQVIACRSTDQWCDLFEKGKEFKKLVVVEFFASLCGSYRIMAPILDELAKKFTGVMFIKVDVDELTDVAAEWNVEALTTFIFLKDGKEMKRVVGADKKGVQEFVVKNSATSA